MTEKKIQGIHALENRLGEFLQENSIDCVILGYDQEELKVLLLKWKFEDIWSLPGGYIHKMEGMDQAAHRVLEERTGLTSIFLRQFYTFGSAGRNGEHRPEEMATMRRILEKIPMENKELDFGWFTKRFVTTGYFALVDLRRTDPNPDFLSESCEWWALDDVPQLLADHNEILEKALEQLRIHLNYLPIGISLLPQKFTMRALQKLYEAILARPLERSNFQRKMLALDILVRHEKQMTGAANKAPYLYSFDRSKYDTLVQKGIGFSF